MKFDYKGQYTQNEKDRVGKRDEKIRGKRKIEGNREGKNTEKDKHKVRQWKINIESEREREKERFIVREREID